jgi:hypothetical protein
MVTMSNVSSYSSPKQEKYKCQTFELKQITMGLIEEQEKYIYIYIYIYKTEEGICS